MENGHLQLLPAAGTARGTCERRVNCKNVQYLSFMTFGSVLPRVGGIKAIWCASDVCQTSVCRVHWACVMNRETGRLKMAQRYPTSLTRTPLSRSKVNLHGAGHIVAASRTACLLEVLQSIAVPCLYTLSLGLVYIWNTLTTCNISCNRTIDYTAGILVRRWLHVGLLFDFDSTAIRRHTLRPYRHCGLNKLCKFVVGFQQFYFVICFVGNCYFKTLKTLWLVCWYL